MMKTNQLIIFLVGLLWPIASLAHTSLPDDGDNLYVYANGAAQAVIYSLDNLDKITFGQNAISIRTKSGRSDYAYKSIDLMTFRSDIKPVTGIKSPTVNNDHVKWMYDRSIQTMSLMSEQVMSGITVFDAQGRVVIKEHVSGKNCQLSLEHIPSGVYVLKVSVPKGNGITIKIIK